MNYYDIHRKLGVEVDYKSKVSHFYTVMLNFVTVYPRDGASTYIDVSELFEICQSINFKLDAFRFDTKTTLDKKYQVADMLHVIVSAYSCLDLAVPSFRNATQYNALFVEFLSVLSVVMQSKYFRKKKNSLLVNTVTKSLYDCCLPYSVSNNIVLPCGAKELDDALIGDVLDWLIDYPKAYKTYSNALTGYIGKKDIREVADNLRKSLEDFLQEFFGNSKNLDNNKDEVGSYLKGKVNKEFATMLSTFMHQYKLYNDSTAKHNDRVKENELEFLVYQTGVFIRLLLQVKKHGSAD